VLPTRGGGRVVPVPCAKRGAREGGRIQGFGGEVDAGLTARPAARQALYPPITSVTSANPKRATGGRGKARLVALGADQGDACVAVAELGIAVRAGGVKAPLEHVARHVDGARAHTVEGALGVGADVDEPYASRHLGVRLPWSQPPQAGARVGEQLIGGDRSARHAPVATVGWGASRGQPGGRYAFSTLRARICSSLPSIPGGRTRSYGAEATPSSAAENWNGGGVGRLELARPLRGRLPLERQWAPSGGRGGRFEMGGMGSGLSDARRSSSRRRRAGRRRSRSRMPRRRGTTPWRQRPGVLPISRTRTQSSGSSRARRASRPRLGPSVEAALAHLHQPRLAGRRRRPEPTPRGARRARDRAARQPSRRPRGARASRRPPLRPHRIDRRGRCPAPARPLPAAPRPPRRRRRRLVCRGAPPAPHQRPPRCPQGARVTGPRTARHQPADPAGAEPGTGTRPGRAGGERDPHGVTRLRPPPPLRIAESPQAAGRRPASRRRAPSSRASSATTTTPFGTACGRTSARTSPPRSVARQRRYSGPARSGHRRHTGVRPAGRRFFREQARTGRHRYAAGVRVQTPASPRETRTTQSPPRPPPVVRCGSEPCTGPDARSPREARAGARARATVGAERPIDLGGRLSLMQRVSASDHFAGTETRWCGAASGGRSRK
jgi:hypothetical protein